MGSFHRALAVSEIPPRILGPCTEGDLESLALVCSSWKEKAQDTKWRTCEVPLKELLKKLTPFRDDNDPDESRAFCEPDDQELEISDEDWSIIRHYAQKVTTMAVNAALYPNWITTIQRRLTTANQKLCPNLVAVELKDVTEEYDLDGTLAILAGTNLRRFSVGRDMDRDADTIRQFDLIADLSVHVTKIDISLFADDFTISPDYTIFRELRQLYVHGVVWRKGWGVISDCPSLMSLTIDRRTWISLSMDGQEQQEDGRVDFFFPNLEFLSVKSPSWDKTDATKLIPSSTMRKLQSLKVTVYDKLSYLEHLKHLHGTSPLLQSLEVDVGMVCLDPYSRVTHLEFKALRRLVLASPYSVRIDDMTIGKIVSSLPELRELCIENTPTGFTSCNHSTYLSYQGLVNLSPSCTLLEDLSISINDPIFFYVRKPCDLNYHAQALGSLRMYHLGIEEEAFEGFADWLATFCPNMHHLEVECLTLCRSESIGKEKIGRFIDSVFEAQRKQLLKPIPSPPKVELSSGDR
ncbi:hypothetical protein FRB95_004705 [Tulasnella sp. JGI-2019a]|nr:hypothetical protein FRB95_004705 [Tulasnella sp. JGI-2019a]